MRPTPRPEITPEVLLRAYACGIFPMAEDAEDDTLFWVEPERRGVIPLQTFAPSTSLRRTIRRGTYEVRVDSDFDAVIAGCASPAPGRETTWISRRIRDLYRQLHVLGHCHTVEAWEDGELVGGLYGLAIRGAFFGESMFATRPDASKVALTYLVARLKAGGFGLLDTQFITPHLARMGAEEIDRSEYLRRLGLALAIPAANFHYWPGAGTSVSVLQATSQTS